MTTCSTDYVSRKVSAASASSANVEMCGLCGGDPLMRDKFKDCALRLLAEVTARNITHR